MIDNTQSKICNKTLELVKSVYLQNKICDEELNTTDYIQEVIKSSDNIPPNTIRFDFKVVLNAEGIKYWKLVKETEYSVATSGDLVYVRSFTY